MTQNDIFIDWVKVRGGHISPSINLFGVFAHGSRGIAATADIQQGDVLVLMPMKACIHAYADDEEEAGSLQLNSLLEALPQSTGPFLRTTLVLMHHMSLGADSPKRAYLDTFPRSHDCTLCWNDTEMDALKGTSIQHTGQRMSRDVFLQHIKPALDAHPDMVAGMGYEAFEYAAGMVQSRTFSINKENFITGESTEGRELYLIPGIDMLNHSTRPEDINTTLQRRTETVSKHSSSHEDSMDFSGFFAIEAERPIKAGEEIMISYGDLSDAQLLQTYGFVEEYENFANPWNFVAVPSNTVAQATKAVQKSAQGGSQKRKRQEEEAEVVFRLTEEEPIPENLLEYVETLAEEEQIIPALLTLADKLTARYEGAQKADEQLLQSGSVRGRQRSAMLVRVGERRLIRRFKEAVIHLLAGDDDEEDEDDGQEGAEEGGSGDSM